MKIKNFMGYTKLYKLKMQIAEMISTKLTDNILSVDAAYSCFRDNKDIIMSSFNIIAENLHDDDAECYYLHGLFCDNDEFVKYIDYQFEGNDMKIDFDEPEFNDYEHPFRFSKVKDLFMDKILKEYPNASFKFTYNYD